MINWAELKGLQKVFNCLLIIFQLKESDPQVKVVVGVRRIESNRLDPTAHCLFELFVFGVIDGFEMGFFGLRHIPLGKPAQLYFCWAVSDFQLSRTLPVFAFKKVIQICPPLLHILEGGKFAIQSVELSQWQNYREKFVFSRVHCHSKKPRDNVCLKSGY